MKKLTLVLLVPSLLLAFGPPVHAPNLASITPPEPQPQIGLVPAVAIGAVVVAGVGWLGIRIANRIIGLWEKQVTNAPPAGIVFTLPPSPEPKSLQDYFDEEESGQ